MTDEMILPIYHESLSRNLLKEIKFRTDMGEIYFHVEYLLCPDSWKV